MLTRNPFRWAAALMVLVLSTPILAVDGCDDTAGNPVIMVHIA